MGKPTGFMEYARELPKDRSSLERVKDWQEFHEHFAEEKLRRTGRALHGLRHSRFAIPGNLISGMASGCPVNNLIPGMERSGLSRPLERSTGAVAQNQ